MKTFEKRFEEFYPKIQSIARHFGSTTPIPEAEYESLLCEKFFLRHGEYSELRGEGSGFHGYMWSILKQEAIRFSQRKERKFYDITSNLDEMMEGSEGDDFPRELVSATNIEVEVENRYFVKDLLSTIKNEETRELLSIFFDAPDMSYREIGRNVGLDHKTVKARIVRVARGLVQT